ncbi:MAG: SIMPL domain-containing protein [Tidjanibacter sp.]|nr:SIMPL domain-containing protein [Tidjanibacter sp.]
MKRFFMTMLMLTMAALTLTAQNTSKYESYIEVTGKAEKEVVPDEIYLSITIDQEKSKAKESVVAQERKMIAALKRIGIDVENNLTVSDMSSDLQTYILRKRTVQTTKTYQLKLNNADQVSKVFETLAQLDIADTQVIKSTCSDMEAVKEQLRVEAMQNARKMADTLAEAIDQKAGSAFLITDNNYMGGSVNYNGLMMTRAAKFDMVTEESTDQSSGIEFKKLKFSYSVNVRFELLPRAE